MQPVNLVLDDLRRELNVDFSQKLFDHLLAHGCGHLVGLPFVQYVAHGLFQILQAFKLPHLLGKFIGEFRDQLSP